MEIWRCQQPTQSGKAARLQCSHTGSSAYTGFAATQIHVIVQTNLSSPPDMFLNI